ncbi:hypothetical protein BDF14DRAFT_1698956, partial [Spinellus fusiger]
LKEETSIDKSDSIIEATKMDPILMSDHANNLINALNDTPLSVKALFQTLYSVVFHQDLDFVINSDAGFMEVTIRHL